MRKGRILTVASTAAFVLLTTALVPTVSAHAAMAPDAGIWSPTGTSTNCPSSMHLLVPNRSSAYLDAHPEDLFSAGQGSTSAAFTQARLRAAAAHVHYLTSITCRAHPSTPVLRTTTATSAAATSANWSGYVSLAKGNFLGAEMLWTVPKVSTDASTDAYSSIWPGVGQGVTGADSLIQGGTEQDAHCVLTVCSQTYYPWIEIVPYESQQEITNLTIAPNQEIQTIIEYDHSFGAYAEIDNLTTGVGVYDYGDFNSSFTGSGSTAEWIVERTEENGKFPPLAKFGTESIADAEAAEGTSWDDPKITYPTVDGLKSIAYTMTTCAGTTLATPGTASDSAFTVTWKNKGVNQSPCS